MISQNVKLIKYYSEDRSFQIHIEGKEINRLNEKYGGMVSVKIGRPIESKTEAQNKAVHALMNAVFDTGMHSSPALTHSEFKLWCKMNFGPCFDWEIEGVKVKVPSKSWADYTKEEAVDFLTRLLDYVDRIGAYAECKKVREIIDGMELKAEEKRSDAYMRVQDRHHSEKPGNQLADNEVKP